jgi:hypothetical protein
MAKDIPDPLKPANISGQNPATPERMPGHTGYYDDKVGDENEPKVGEGKLAREEKQSQPSGHSNRNEKLQP